jgi:hypothetical protein
MAVAKSAARRSGFQNVSKNPPRGLLRSGTRQEWLAYRDREKPSDGLEPSTPSLPSSNEAGTAGTPGKPRARKPRKKKETPEGK